MSLPLAAGWAGIPGLVLLAAGTGAPVQQFLRVFRPSIPRVYSQRAQPRPRLPPSLLTLLSAAAVCGCACTRPTSSGCLRAYVKRRPDYAEHRAEHSLRNWDDEDLTVANAAGQLVLAPCQPGK